MAHAMYLTSGFVLLVLLFPIIAVGMLTPLPFDDIIIWYWIWPPIAAFVGWVLQKGRGR